MGWVRLLCLWRRGRIDQYDVYPLYDGGVCDKRKHKQEAQEEMLGAGSWRRWMGFGAFIEIMGFCGGWSRLVSESGSEAYQRVSRKG